MDPILKTAEAISRIEYQRQDPPDFYDEEREEEEEVDPDKLFEEWREAQHGF